MGMGRARQLAVMCDPCHGFGGRSLEDAAYAFQNRMASLKSGADGDGSAYYGRGLGSPFFPLDSFCVASPS